MIITVTLNAAMDKTLEVPNFTPGRRHRTVDQTTMPGGKGVNIARAIKRLGQPVIATGLRRRRRPAAGSSRRSTTSRSSTTSSASATSRAPTPRCSTPPPGCRPRSTSAARRSRPRSSSCSARSCCTWPRARASACSPAACPAGSSPTSTPALIREVRRLGVTTMIDTDGEPLRLAMRAEPDIVSPNELEAEELVGHEFNDADDRAQAVVEMTRLGAARGDHDRLGRLLRPHARGRVAGAVPGADRRAGGAVGDRLGRRVPGRLRRCALLRARPGRVPALRGRLRGRVDAAFRRRHPRRRRGWTGCWARSSPSASRSAPRSADAPVCSGVRNLRLIAPGPRLEGDLPLLASTSRWLPPRAPLNRPPRVLRCVNGSRDRSRKEGSPGIRVRRHRDRPFATHARP